MAKKTPNMLAAIDRRRKRVFVLAMPNLSAIKVEGEWIYAEPLSDEEIPHYDLITDMETVESLVDEARKELGLSPFN